MTLSNIAAASVLMVMASGSSVLAYDLTPLVSLAVQADRDRVAAHRIDLFAEGTGPSALAPEDRIWIAVRASDRGSEEISSKTCPALKGAAVAFGHLPPIRPINPGNRVQQGPAPLGPTIKDGYDVVITYRVEEFGQVELRGVPDYASWANTAVGAVVGCLGPLRP